MAVRIFAVSLTLLATLTVFAGCIADDVAETGDDALDGLVKEPTVLGWGYADCDAAIAIIDVPTAAIQPHLPEGFEVMTLAEANGPPGVRGDAAFGVEVFYCDDGVGLNDTSTGQVAYGSYWTFVHPPAELVNDNATFHFYKWDVLIQDADLREVLVEHGVPARDATIESATPAVFQQTPAGAGAFQMGFFWDGDGEQAVSVNGGSSAAPFGNEDIIIREFTETEHGLVVWETRALSKMFISAGYARIPPVGLSAEIVGEERVPCAIIAGPMSFTEGTITLPPMVVEATMVAAAEEA